MSVLSLLFLRAAQRFNCPFLYIILDRPVPFPVRPFAPPPRPMADIYRAAESGNLQALFKWLKKGTPVDSFLKATKATPLIWAARKSHPSAVKLLIRYKATLDLQDVNGNTALHYACQNKDAKTANILIEAGASLSLPNKNGQCPSQLSDFNFFKAQVIQYYDDRIAENTRRFHIIR